MSPHRESVPLTGLWIAAAAFLLGLWGVMTVLSARTGADQPLNFPLRQLFRLLLAMAAMVLAWRVPFVLYRKLTPVLAVLAWIPIVLLPWLGVRIHGMCGWIELGTWQYQPSELAKPFFLLLLVDTARRGRNDFEKLLWLCGVTAVWTLPIVCQPDLGTTAVYWGTALAVYFLMAKNWMWLTLPVTAMTAAAAFYAWRLPYAGRRLTGFWNPESDPLGSGWHVRQFQLAIAHGHWFGAKLRQTVWSTHYLPLAHNDSAYATMVETLGVAGALPAVLLVLVLGILLFRLARRCAQNEFARGYLAAAAVLLVWQSFLHLGVNATLLPPTGLTWPFVSYGGSSLLSCGILLGIALSAGDEESAS